MIMSEKQLDMFDIPDITECPKCGDDLEIGGGMLNYCQKCDMMYMKDYYDRAK